MYLYILLSSIILLLFVLLFRAKYGIDNRKKSVDAMSLPTNISTENFIEKLTDLLQRQQNQQEQLIQTQLMNLFRIPKLRGIQGEKWLESQLKEVLPSQHFSIQHTFTTGVICDAVVHLPNGKLIPIDSKFSFENFRLMMNSSDENQSKEFEKEHLKDIKSRINEISNKYILPNEGTIDFAFMFVPAESVYYHSFVEKDNGLQEYAMQKKVIVTSPSTLYTYLQFVKYGLDGHHIQKNAQLIQQNLGGIVRDLKLFSDEYNKLKDKLEQAQKNFSNSFKHFSNAQSNLNTITSLQVAQAK